ncbi:MAG: prephenate dehydrogenase/arogenate dehydrogenase family protein, partial [Candidatus Atribacteria bacterium]|nr:prephenate dehydrogenase/arogenate dehydrogenase family protein [Candidatus Atribacteria bacterium]
PQLIAVIMSNMLGLLVKKNNNEQYFKISGNVFQEMTRVATSPFNIWKDIYQTNGKFTIDFIVELEDWLDKIKEKIAHNPAALEEDFERAKYFKEQMLKMTG